MGEWLGCGLGCVIPEGVVCVCGGERPSFSGSQDAHWCDVVGTGLDSVMSRVLPGQTSSSPGV